MFVVYILYSKKYNKTYVGYTSNLEGRLLSHNVLSTKGYTIKYRPWELIYSEEYSLKSDALKREKYFKSGHGREWVKEKLKSKLSSQS